MSQYFSAAPPGGSYTAPVPGQMYDPAVQRAVLEKLARWRHLPEGDLIGMLSPVERLRYRPEALDDLEWDGLIVARVAGDERMVSITEAGEEWLRQFDQPGARSESSGAGSESNREMGP